MRVVVAPLLMLALVGCAGEDGGTGTNMLGGIDLSARGGRHGNAGGQVTGNGDTQLVYFDDGGPATGGAGTRSGIYPSDGGYTINLHGVHVADAARSLLGEVLKQPYSIAPDATGSITIATGGSVSRERLLMIFEEALAANGLVLLEGGGQFTIRRNDGRQLPASFGKSGYGLTAVSLENVDAERMLALLDGFIANQGDLRASARDGMILIRGTARERASVMEIALALDVEMMSRSSAGIAFLRNTSAEAVRYSLEDLQQTDSGAATWKFQVLGEPNAILLLARSRDDLRKAMTWIERFDRAGGREGGQVHVYRVQHTRASQLTAVLEATLGRGTVGTSAAGAQSATSGGDTPELAFPESITGKAPTLRAAASAQDEVRFIANDADNTIIIRAPGHVRRDALAILAELDKPPVQVLIDVMLVEVSLNDATRFGVQAFLAGQDVGLLSGATSANGIANQIPGFNLILGGTSSPKVIIDSLEQVTKTRVVSAPSVVAFENTEAEIKIVDQVPITTQQVVGTQAADAPVINSIEYRDAGVILRVTPQVSETNLVNLLVRQELSAVVVDATAGNTLTPKLRQRSIDTQVSVYDQQTIVLGGLISSQATKDRQGAPLLGIFGGGRKSKSDSRTELIIFITPHVVRNQRDAAAISEELRSKMRAMSGR